MSSSMSVAEIASYEKGVYINCPAKREHPCTVSGLPQRDFYIITVPRGVHCRLYVFYSKEFLKAVLDTHEIAEQYLCVQEKSSYDYWATWKTMRVSVILDPLMSEATEERGEVSREWYKILRINRVGVVDKMGGSWTTTFQTRVDSSSGEAMIVCVLEQEGKGRVEVVYDKLSSKERSSLFSKIYGPSCVIS